MKKIILIIIFLMLSFSKSFAEISNLKVKVGFGWGEYLMDLPKQLNSEIMMLTPFDDKIISNYPGYYNYNVGFVYPLSEKADFGVYYGRISTGSLISVKDYSGEYRYESLVSANCLGLSVYILLFGANGPFKVKADIGGGFFNAYFTSTEFLTIASETDKHDFSFDGTGKYILPSINLSYETSFGEFGLKFGYFADYDPNDENIMDWSGLRYSINYSIKPLKMIE
jgi:hypothetical protein